MGESNKPVVNLISRPENMLKTVNLDIKKRDFEHLLFDSTKSSKILLFPEFIKDW